MVTKYVVYHNNGTEYFCIIPGFLDRYDFIKRVMKVMNDAEVVSHGYITDGLRVSPEFTARVEKDTVLLHMLLGITTMKLVKAPRPTAMVKSLIDDAEKVIAETEASIKPIESVLHTSARLEVTVCVVPDKIKVIIDGVPQ